MLISTAAFLRLILPTEGYYCAVVFRAGDKTPHQYFNRSVDAIVEHLLIADAHGHTAYHACASFKAPDRRTQDNARAARCLWLDIDAYPTPTEAMRAVGAFARAKFFPPTCVVESGRGIHCYWQLEKELGGADWREIAASFRESCDDFGLQADHSRTCDIASILRPPETTNRKYGDLRVVRGYAR